MRNGYIPYIIDWEAAGYVNPYQELIEILNYWCCNSSGELDYEKANRLLDAYTDNMNISNVDLNAAINSGYSGMLGWLEYNLKRALGIKIMDDNEVILGREQVIGTLKELMKYEQRGEEIKKLLYIRMNRI